MERFNGWYSHSEASELYRPLVPELSLDLTIRAD